MRLSGSRGRPARAAKSFHFALEKDGSFDNLLHPVIVLGIGMNSVFNIGIMGMACHKFANDDSDVQFHA